MFVILGLKRKIKRREESIILLSTFETKHFLTKELT